MKKILLKDLEHFRSWQREVARVLDDTGQNLVSSMPTPDHYPVVLVWTVFEFLDYKYTSMATKDKIEYNFVYIDTFPVKELKRGMYVYQLVKTDEAFQVLMES